MKILYLRENVVGIGEAHRSIDTGFVVPPNGFRLVAIDTTYEGICAVRKEDTRYTYITIDGSEAVDLEKVRFDGSGSRLAFGPPPKD